MARLQFMPVNDFDRGLIDKFDGQGFDYNPAAWERMSQMLPADTSAPLNDFDKELVQKFEGNNFDYNHALWEQLAGKLPPTPAERRRRIGWLPLTGIAAAVALLISVPFFWNNKSASTDAVIVNAVKSKNTPIVQQHQPPDASATAVSPAPIQLPASVVGRANPSSPYSSNTVNNIQTPIVLNNTPIISAPVPGAVVPTTPVENNPPGAPIVPDIITPAAPLTEMPKQFLSVAPPVQLKAGAPKLLPEVSPVKKDHYLDIDPDETRYASQSQSRKLKISLAGGYNRGNTNLGYMVGFNTRKNLGSKIYVEGDVAFASSRNDQETISLPEENYETFRTLANNQLTAKPTAAKEAQVVNQLYYMQITPVVGYQVLDKLSVGAGADVQRLFRDGDKESFIVEDKIIKSMPAMDVGLVGKTEYTIYRNVKAGVQYRYGMNEVISPEKNYVNRSYLQVQLKVGIIGNK